MLKLPGNLKRKRGRLFNIIYNRQNYSWHDFGMQCTCFVWTTIFFYPISLFLEIGIYASKIDSSIHLCVFA